MSRRRKKAHPQQTLFPFAEKPVPKEARLRWNFSDRRVWFTCQGFTITMVLSENDVIVGGAPVISKFLGQPFDNLVAWAKRKWPGSVEYMDTDS